MHEMLPSGPSSHLRKTNPPVLSRLGERKMDKKRLFAISLGVATLLGVSTGGALAGEVKGPPGTVDNTNATGAPTNSNSNCSYSGLNDFDSEDEAGQNESFVQTVADAWKYYGLPHGFNGLSGACRGGTNESREK